MGTCARRSLFAQTADLHVAGLVPHTGAVGCACQPRLSYTRGFRQMLGVNNFHLRLKKL